MANSRSRSRKQDEEPEEETEALEEGDDEAFDEGDDEAFDEDGAQDISLSINEDVVEIVIPRNGEEEKTLTALGQAIQSLGS
jgi:hypothetical protein